MHARRSWFAVAVGLVALAIPASAGAATEIGETFTPPGGDGGPLTVVQTGSPEDRYTIPSAGVLTSWSFQAPSMFANPIALKVLRPSTGDAFTTIGADGPRAVTAGTAHSFPVQIAVHAGDKLGLSITPVFTRYVRSASSAYTYRFTMSDPPLGSTVVFPSGGDSLQLDVSAILEPDCDGDGFGDETQDPSVLGGSCPPRGRSLTFEANKNKVKKGKKVTLSGQVTEIAGQGECQTGQTVQLERKKPSQTTFTTLEQLQTDAAGNFSTKEKVKKTFEYRAQVAETATCGTALSNSEKVKVKKPK